MQSAIVDWTVKLISRLEFLTYKQVTKSKYRSYQKSFWASDAAWCRMKYRLTCFRGILCHLFKIKSRTRFLKNWNQFFGSFPDFKASSDPSHFICEINVGKSRIRHRTTMNLNDAIFNQFWDDLDIHHSISVSLYVESDTFRHWFHK